MLTPIKGLPVVDLTPILSGTYSSIVLADLGAATIKIELLIGEGTRKLSAADPNNSSGCMDPYFITLHRNKKSITINLKEPLCKMLFQQLVKKSDTVIHNFSADVTKNLGLDHPTFSRINSRIITCAINGFGSDGPGCMRPALDQVAQATDGRLSITDLDSDQPVRAGVSVGDPGGWMYGAMGILTAVIERDRSGKEQCVDRSILDFRMSILN